MSQSSEESHPPLVSIICLTYNHGGFIVDALNGFLHQKTDFQFEVIVHDDASTDNTVERILVFAKEHPEIIRFIAQTENQMSRGISGFATAYGVARGRYIAYCEGDDYWMDPHKLQTQVDFLEANPSYVMTYSDCISVRKEKNGWVVDQVKATTRDLTPEELGSGYPLHSLTVCFRRVVEFPIEFGFAPYGDLFIWNLLAAHGGGKYLKLEKPCVYRIHSGGVHSLADAERRYEMIILTYALMIRYLRRVGKKELAALYRRKAVGESVRFLLRRLPGLLWLYRGIKKCGWTVASIVQKFWKSRDH